MSPTRAERSRALLAAALLAAALAWPPAASAHQPDPTVVTVLDEVVPALPPSVRVEVARSVADQLVASNDSDQSLEVLADTGEAFLRIGPSDVRANLGSPTWYATSSPLGALPAGAPRTPTAARLVTVSRGTSWGWFDHRLHPSAPVLSDDIRSGRRTVRLAEWTVPMRYGGRRVDVRGHLEFRPVVGGLRSRVTTTDLPDGLTLQVLEGRVPGLFARYEGAGTLEVRGRDGEPFARISAAGAEVNLLSPTYVDDQLLRGRAPRSPADSGAVPRWERTSSQPGLSWLDRRLAYQAAEVPPDALARSGPTTLVRWRVPFGVAGAQAAAEGVTEWVPAVAAPAPGADTDRRRVALAGVAAAALLVGAAVVVRRRRRG